MIQHTMQPHHVDESMQLIPVADRNIGGEGVQTVNARELHAFLEVKTEFRNWITNRIEDFDFIEGEHFAVTVEKSRNLQGGRPAKDYHLTLDMAKHLAMVERNAKGREARDYFIACERRAKAAAVAPALDLSDPKQLLHLLTQTAETAAVLQSTIEAQTPKVRFFEAVAASHGAQSIGEVAKSLGTGRNRLFAFLRESGVILEDNTPRQTHVEAGHFIVRQRVYEDGNGESHSYSRVLVTGRGLTWLQKKWADRRQIA